MLYRAYAVKSYHMWCVGSDSIYSSAFLPGLIMAPLWQQVKGTISQNLDLCTKQAHQLSTLLAPLNFVATCYYAPRMLKYYLLYSEALTFRAGRLRRVKTRANSSFRSSSLLNAASSLSPLSSLQSSSCPCDRLASHLASHLVLSRARKTQMACSMVRTMEKKTQKACSTVRKMERQNQTARLPQWERRGQTTEAISSRWLEKRQKLCQCKKEMWATHITRVCHTSVHAHRGVCNTS